MTKSQNFQLKLPRFGHPTLAERKARKGWLFVLPFVVGFLLVYLPIIIDSICFSFMSVDIKTDSGGNAFTMVTNHGFEFYKQMFGDSEFTSALLSGVGQLALEVPAVVIFSLFVAVILNQKMLGRAVFRAIFFVPVILSTGMLEALTTSSAATGEESNAIDDGSGQGNPADFISAMDVEALLGNMAVGNSMVSAGINLVNDVFNIISYSGVQMLIFLAGLQSISPSIYEAARIDGASAWETFWKITFPMISPMILVNGIYTIIDSFTRSNNTVMTFIDGIYKDKSQSLATAEYWLYFLIVFAIVAIFGGIVSAYVFYQKRD